MGRRCFKLLALVRQCFPTSVKQPPPAPPCSTTSSQPYHWPNWMLSPTCLHVTGSWPRSLGLLIPTVTQDEPKRRFVPPVSFLLVPQLLCAVPALLLVLLSPPQSLSPGLQSAQEASPGAYLSTQAPCSCHRSRGRIISGFNLASLLQGLPQGMGFLLSGWFPKSLSRVGPRLPTKQSPAERPPPSQHTSEVFVQYGACDLARMGFGCPSIFYGSFTGVCPASTLVLISPQGCGPWCCLARGDGIFLYG